jgi:hypothetical protein
MNVAPSAVGDPSPLGACCSRHRPRIFHSIIAISLCWSCAGGATDVSEDTVERDGFIGAFVDLRIAAVYAGSTNIGDAVRDSILTVNGVDEQDLMDFVAIHGEDVEFMSDLWTEVEARLTARLERTEDEIDGGDDGISPEL